LLFGATDMRVWNIHIDLEKERLDFSRFRKEFIEYKTVLIMARKEVKSLTVLNTA
jgi:hypothetical protein